MKKSVGVGFALDFPEYCGMVQSEPVNFTHCGMEIGVVIVVEFSSDGGMFQRFDFYSWDAYDRYLSLSLWEGLTDDEQSEYNQGVWDYLHCGVPLSAQWNALMLKGLDASIAAAGKEAA